MKNIIRLEKCLYSDYKIIYQFSSNLKIFTAQSFCLEYSSHLPEKIESIVTIPFVALMAPLGWLTGAEIYVPELDNTYFKSIQTLEAIYKTWYPKWRFNNSIHAQLKNNNFPTSQPGLLLSLGLDSLTSFIRHQNEKPFLFTAVDISRTKNNKAYWELYENKIQDFKNSFGLNGVLIRTDIRHLIDEKKLRWWSGIAQGFCLTGMTAPFSCHFLKTLYIASSFSSLAVNRGTHWGTTPTTDNLIAWASTQVSHDNDTFERYEKLKYQFKPHPEIYPYLKVCGSQFQTLNCTYSEKCLRTILGLLINNIDPTLCNFPITHQTLKHLKRRLKYDVFCVPPSDWRLWIHIKDNVDLNTLKDMHGSKEFFQWFKTFSFSNSLLTKAFFRLSWLCTYRYNENWLVDALHSWAKHFYSFYAHVVLKFNL